MRLPLFTLIAPIVSSVVLWLVLGNPAVLLFALLGPLMAMGAFLDAGRSARRIKAEGEAKHDLELAQLEHAQRSELATARVDAEAEHPPVSWFVREGKGIPPRWAHSELPEHRQVRIGVDSLTRMPAVVDLAAGLAIVATGVVGASVWRAIHGLLDWFYSPDGGEEARNHGLVTMYSENGMVPSNTPLVLRVNPDATAVLTDFRRLTSNVTTLNVDLLTSPEFDAVRTRIESTRSELTPSIIAASDLSCGTANLDLVQHGPHALLVGMTGSGKTEFLLSWLAHQAEIHTPDQLNILLLDYKGGVGLGRLSELPHVVGLVSDLSPALVERVLVSLRAEIRSRERILAEHRSHDVATLPPGILPRLVVVIDEYRALREATPDAAGVFADVASRGRALGIHLVVSTQQLGGLSEGILSNCGLRICFRMTDAQDVRTLIGSDVASSPSQNTGSALILGTGLELSHVQFMMLGAPRLADITQAARGWVAAHPDWVPRIPWCEPLPALLTQLPSNLVAAHTPRTSAMLCFGLSDLPHEQRQELAVWDPKQDGHLHVQGGLGSGRSTTMRTLAESARNTGHVIVTLTTAEQLWDCVVGSDGAGHHDFPARTLIFIDDLDALTASFSVEHREVFFAALLLRLRTSPAGQTWFVLSTLDNGSTCAWVSRVVRTSLKLNATDWTSSPGLTVWHGHTTRITLSPTPDSSRASAPEARPANAPVWQPGHTYVVVTHRVRAVIRHLTEQGLPDEAVHDVGLPLTVEQTNPTVQRLHPRIYLGDCDSWQANYTLLGQLRRAATIIFDGCSPSEVRSLRLHRGLLPHVEPGHALTITPDGDIHRMCLTPESIAESSKKWAA